MILKDVKHVCIRAWNRFAIFLHQRDLKIEDPRKQETPGVVSRNHKENIFVPHKRNKVGAAAEFRHNNKFPHLMIHRAPSRDRLLFVSRGLPFITASLE